MFNPTISPHDKNTVLVSCDMTGSYITHDGGQSWRMFNLRGRVEFFTFDPKNPQIIYAETKVLWRSQDGGRTWSLRYPNASSVKDIEMNSDHAEETVMAQPDSLGRDYSAGNRPRRFSHLIRIGFKRIRKWAICLTRFG